MDNLLTSSRFLVKRFGCFLSFFLIAWQCVLINGQQKLQYSFVSSFLAVVTVWKVKTLRETDGKAFKVGQNPGSEVLLLILNPSFLFDLAVCLGWWQTLLLPLCSFLQTRCLVSSVYYSSTFRISHGIIIDDIQQVFTQYSILERLHAVTG